MVFITKVVFAAAVAEVVAAVVIVVTLEVQEGEIIIIVRTVVDVIAVV